MRESMLALVKAGGHEAHPAFWAPFVVVGADGKGVKRLASADPVTSPSTTAAAARPSTTTSNETYIITALPAANAVTPVDPSAAVDQGGVIVKMPLPVRGPSVKERKASVLKPAKKRKPGFKPNSISAWEDVFSR